VSPSPEVDLVAPRVVVVTPASPGEAPPVPVPVLTAVEIVATRPTADVTDGEGSLVVVVGLVVDVVVGVVVDVVEVEPVGASVPLRTTRSIVA
jgi:hypothetical protein